MQLSKIIPKTLTKRLVALGLSSAAAISGGYLIAPNEGLPVDSNGKHPVYIDAVGIPTVCWGQTGKDLYGRTIRLGMSYTTAECETMLAQTIQKFETQVDMTVHVPYSSDWQKAALISFAYNVGIGNLKSSTLLRKLNAKDYDGACNELTKWVYANKKKLPGLVSRRGEEKQWCLGNVPYEAKVTYQEIVKGYVKAGEKDNE